MPYLGTFQTNPMPGGNPLWSAELHRQWIWPSEGQIKPAMSEPTKSCFHTLARVSSLAKHRYKNKHFWAASFSWGGPWAAGCQVWGVTVSFPLASSGDSPCWSWDLLLPPPWPPTGWCTSRAKAVLGDQKRDFTNRVQHLSGVRGGKQGAVKVNFQKLLRIFSHIERDEITGQILVSVTA